MLFSFNCVNILFSNFPIIACTADSRDWRLSSEERLPLCPELDAREQSHKLRNARINSLCVCVCVWIANSESASKGTSRDRSIPHNKAHSFHQTPRARAPQQSRNHVTSRVMSRLKCLYMWRVCVFECAAESRLEDIAQSTVANLRIHHANAYLRHICASRSNAKHMWATGIA